MKYTISGKEYTELDINKRCAELLGLVVKVGFEERLGAHFTKSFHEEHPNTIWCAEVDNYGQQVHAWEQKVFTHDAADTWPIIEKVWCELMTCYNYDYSPRWQDIMDDHNCTKLVAACICFIETNEAKQ